MADTKREFEQAFYNLVLSKSVSKVSINEIVLASGCSKSSFYRLYQDKYDLALSIYRNNIERILRNLGNDMSLKKIMRETLEYLKSEQAYYKKLFKDSRDPDSFYGKYIDFMVDQTINAIGRLKLTGDQLLLIRYWCNSCASLNADWLIKGANESIDWIMDMSYRLMPSEIEDIYSDKDDALGQTN